MKRTIKAFCRSLSRDRDQPSPADPVSSSSSSDSSQEHSGPQEHEDPALQDHEDQDQDRGRRRTRVPETEAGLHATQASPSPSPIPSFDLSDRAGSLPPVLPDRAITFPLPGTPRHAEIEFDCETPPAELRETPSRRVDITQLESESVRRAAIKKAKDEERQRQEDAWERQEQAGIVRRRAEEEAQKHETAEGKKLKNKIMTKLILRPARKLPRPTPPDSADLGESEEPVEGPYGTTRPLGSSPTRPLRREIVEAGPSRLKMHDRHRSASPRARPYSRKTLRVRRHHDIKLGLISDRDPTPAPRLAPAYAYRGIRLERNLKRLGDLEASGTAVDWCKMLPQHVVDRRREKGLLRDGSSSEDIQEGETWELDDEAYRQRMGDDVVREDGEEIVEKREASRSPPRPADYQLPLELSDVVAQRAMQAIDSGRRRLRSRECAAGDSEAPTTTSLIVSNAVAHEGAASVNPRNRAISPLNANTNPVPHPTMPDDSGQGAESPPRFRLDPFVEENSAASPNRGPAWSLPHRPAVASSSGTSENIQPRAQASTAPDPDESDHPDARDSRHSSEAPTDYEGKGKGRAEGHGSKPEWDGKNWNVVNAMRLPLAGYAPMGRDSGSAFKRMLDDEILKAVIAESRVKLAVDHDMDDEDQAKMPVSNVESIFDCWRNGGDPFTDQFALNEITGMEAPPNPILGSEAVRGKEESSACLNKSHKETKLANTGTSSHASGYQGTLTGTIERCWVALRDTIDALGGAWDADDDGDRQPLLARENDHHQGVTHLETGNKSSLKIPRSDPNTFNTLLTPQSRGNAIPLPARPERLSSVYTGYTTGQPLRHSSIESQGPRLHKRTRQMDRSSPAHCVSIPDLLLDIGRPTMAMLRNVEREHASSVDYSVFTNHGSSRYEPTSKGGREDPPARDRVQRPRPTVLVDFARNSPAAVASEPKKSPVDKTKLQISSATSGENVTARPAPDRSHSNGCQPDDLCRRCTGIQKIYPSTRPQDLPPCSNPNAPIRKRDSAKHQSRGSEEFEVKSLSCCESDATTAVSEGSGGSDSRGNSLPMLTPANTVQGEFRNTMNTRNRGPLAASNRQASHGYPDRRRLNLPGSDGRDGNQYLVDSLNRTSQPVQTRRRGTRLWRHGIRQDDSCTILSASTPAELNAETFVNFNQLKRFLDSPVLTGDRVQDYGINYMTPSSCVQAPVGEEQNTTDAILCAEAALSCRHEKSSGPSRTPTLSRQPGYSCFDHSSQNATRAFGVSYETPEPSRSPIIDKTRNDTDEALSAEAVLSPIAKSAEHSQDLCDKRAKAHRHQLLAADLRASWYMSEHGERSDNPVNLATPPTPVSFTSYHIPNRNVDDCLQSAYNLYCFITGIARHDIHALTLGRYVEYTKAVERQKSNIKA